MKYIQNNALEKVEKFCIKFRSEAYEDTPMFLFHSMSWSVDTWKARSSYKERYSP